MIRPEDIVHVCSDCGAIKVEGVWTLGATIPEGKLPSHGYCNGCFYSRMTALGVPPERVESIPAGKELAADGR